MQPHRSSALDGAAAILTVALRHGVAVPLSWSWSHHPQGRACAAAPARRGTLGRTPYHTSARQPPSGTPYLAGRQRVRGAAPEDVFTI